MALELIHITAAYSNAVLLAIITNISDCAKQLDLPTPQPVTISQVQKCLFYPHKGYPAQASVFLTNGMFFMHSHRGYVDSYRSSSNYFFIPDDWGPEDYIKATNYWGRMNMTTNEVVEFARNALRKLGYDPKKMNAAGPPTEFEGPPEFQSHTVPQCRVEWNTSDEDEKIFGRQIVRVIVNAETKQILYFYLSSTNAWRTPPKIDVEPELESDFRKRTQGTMFIRSNAPPRRPTPVVLPARPGVEKE